MSKSVFQMWFLLGFWVRSMILIISITFMLCLTVSFQKSDETTADSDCIL